MPLYLTWEQSEHIRLRYVCSDCWEPVEATKVDDDLYEITCATHGCTTPALISNASVEWRKRMSEHYILLARKALRDALPWLKKERTEMTEDQIVKSLGY